MQILQGKLYLHREGQDRCMMFDHILKNSNKTTQEYGLKGRVLPEVQLGLPFQQQKELLLHNPDPKDIRDELVT